MRKLRAWRTRCPAIGSDNGIVKTETAAKAKYQAYLSARDAGYNVSITDFGAVRDQKYDNAKFNGNPIKAHRAYAIECLEI